MSKLAIDGGEKVWTVPFPGWPIWNQKDVDAVKGVFDSGVWGIGNTIVKKSVRWRR